MCNFHSKSASNGGAIYYTDVDFNSASLLDENANEDFDLIVSQCVFAQNEGDLNGGAIGLSLTNSSQFKPILKLLTKQLDIS